jgi:lipoate-protein ligase A
MERWRLITTWDAPPAWNMGLDQALLETPEAPPTLRLYTWKPGALSLGYFQKYAEVPAVEEAPLVVRRITGGGAIHHQRELTFSICVGLDHPLYSGSVGDSYTRVHAVIARTLAEFGVTALARGDRELLSDREGTGMCFHRSSSLDLVWNERKGVGSAQRRKAGRVLHHGSIKLDTTALEGEIASVADARRGVTPQQFAARWVEHLSADLGLKLGADAPTAEERTRAKELARRFEDQEFTRRR